MRHALASVVGALVLAGCSLRVDYTGTLYACDADGACPAHYACVENRCVPAEPPAPTCAQGVATGTDHTCVVRTDGTAWCWGRNDAGQLGDGSTVDRVQPVAVTGLAGVSQLAAGNAHTCAIVDGGAVLCWGHNNVGQLGNGQSTDVTHPDQRAVDRDAVALAVGNAHTCAQLASGAVTCWGANESGQCGAPTSDAIVEVPTRVPNLVEGPYRALALGARHSCVLAEDGRVQCWGDNAQGQVGPDAPAGFGAHTLELDGERVYAIEIGAGESHTCARTADDAVVCWGDNGALQLGALSSEETRTHHWLEIGCE